MNSPSADPPTVAPKITTPGVLLSVSGIDGAGKSTLIAALQAELGAAGHRVRTMPSIAPGPFVDLYKLAVRDDNFSTLAQNYVFLFERYRSTIERVMPALHEGDIVILDRYLYCDIAFSDARRRDSSMYWNYMNMFPTPHVALLVDVAAEVAMQRIHSRGKAPWRFQENEELLRRVREQYLALAPRIPMRILSGLESPDINAKRVVRDLDARGILS